MNKFFYIAAGMTAFLGFILTMAPASLAISFAEDRLSQVPNLEVGRVDGRIWAGSAQFQYRQFPAVISWNLAALPLLIGRVSADVDVIGDGLIANFQVSASSSEGTVSEATARIDASYINQVSLDYGLDLSGQFSMNAEEVSYRDRWLTSASGNLDWPGGIVHIETPQRLYSVDLPPLTGDLSMKETSLLLAINSPDARMLDIALKPNGWAEVAVSFAFMELAGLPISGNASASSEEPAILLEEKIL